MDTAFHFVQASEGDLYVDGQERAKRAMDIGDAAADYQPGQKRNAFINEACRGDETLKQLILDYLQAGEDLFNEQSDPAGLRNDKHVGSRLLQSLLGDGSFGVAPGNRLGPYEIITLIGEGGMGEVYKARDTRLDRIVALKISKKAFSARFALEARAAASINHSNICTLHDVGSNYLVMEYIEGDHPKGPLAVDQALRYAIQICSALDAAHRKGITHRDLKPENILVTKSGVKLLDFGLAKIDRCEEFPEIATAPEMLTGKQEVIGSLCYMSPEQLRGADSESKIDGRSDIFSFGLVLYQLLTGKRLFDGPSPADVIAGILERPTPSILSLAPASLDRLLQRCLNKDPDDRWQTARDLKAELEWIASTASLQAREHPSVRPRAIGYVPWILAIACTIGLFMAILRNPAPWLSSPQPVTRATIILPDRTFVTPSVSRDGTRLLYGQGSGQTGVTPRLWLRMMDQLEGHPVPGTEDGILGTFSPDGHWIAFFKGPPPFKLAKIPVNGGNPVIISSRLTGAMTSPYWGDDDSILVGTEQGLLRIPASGARTETLTTIDRAKNEIGHFEPVLLPGNRGVIFTVATGSSLDTARDSAQIGVLDLQSHAYQVLHISGSTPKYVPTGHLIYRRRAALFAVPFDVSHLRVIGSEALALEGLTTGLVTGASPYSFSQSGLLVYRSGNESKESTTLAWIDRKGSVQAIPEPPHPWQTVLLSPDGRKVVGDIPDAGEGVVSQRIFTYDLEHNHFGRLTPGGSEYERDYGPIWTHDGSSVTFGSLRAGSYGIYQVPVESTQQPQLLLATKTMSYPSSWASNGTMLLYYQFEQWRPQLFVLPVMADGKSGEPQTFHPGAASPELQAVISPNGKWVAYTSDRSGNFEIYVSPFPGAGRQFLVSDHGGRQPTWSPNGEELFYVERNPARLMEVEILDGSSFRRTAPRPLFTIRSDGGPTYYDVSPDGRRFLVLMPSKEAASFTSPAAFVVVTDWFEELVRCAPLKK